MSCGPRATWWGVACLALAAGACGDERVAAPARGPSTLGGPASTAGSGGARPPSAVPPLLAKPLPPAAPQLGPDVLGRTPAPFGTAAAIRAGMTGAQMLALVPGARFTRGEKALEVDLGVGGLRGTIELTAHGQLDWLQLDAWPGVEGQFEAAWGRPSGVAAEPYWLSDDGAGGGWRADIGPLSGGPRAAVVSIGPYVRFDRLIGDHPDGLGDPGALVGAPLRELLAGRLGKRIEPSPRRGSDDDDGWAPRFRIQLPATDVCRYFTTVDLWLDDDDVVRRAGLRLCYPDDRHRDAARDAMMAAWGRPRPLDDEWSDGAMRYRFVHRGRLLEAVAGRQRDGDGPSAAAVPDDRGQWLVTITEE